MPKMTSEQAQTFDRTSQVNAEILLATAEDRGCQCLPYINWFTYNRWLAQGYQVERGQHGVKLTAWIVTTKKDEEGNEVVTGRRPKGYSVFCQCQVKKA